MDNDNQKLYSPREVAQKVGFCYRTVLNYLHLGKVKVYKVGNRHYLDDEMITQLKETLRNG